MNELKRKHLAEFYHKYFRLPDNDKELSRFILFGSIKEGK